jgi:tetratricopeptide (TPR) repeat protein
MSEPNVAGALPMVSVIVRSEGRPALAAALASIAAQNYPAIEVIVVAPPMPADAVVPEWCGPHRVRLVQTAAGLSPPEAANAGLDAATGDWITFLDEADVFLSEHLSGLMAVRDGAPDSAVIHSLAQAVFADGRELPFGQPYCLAQLYDHNFIHLSAAVFRRSLREQGCRFDPNLPVHHEWDLFLQMAQRASFRFVPRRTFRWNVGAGGYGFGDGITPQDATEDQCRRILQSKWAGHRDALIDRVEPLLRSAAEAKQHGNAQGAEALCHEVLAFSPYDPWALNLLASIERDTGRASDARRTQELAVAVRPQDSALVYNLALLYRAQGNLERAGRCCDRALELDPEFVPARRLREELSHSQIVR